LRKSGLTIICVIHQPRWLVFQEFTHVLLLGEGGSTVYWGRQEKLVPYLQSLGFTRPESENPADWMIDVCSGLEKRIDPATGQEDNRFRCPDDLYKNWREKMAPNALKDGFEPTAGDPTLSDLSLAPLKARHGASTAEKVYYMTSRTFKRISAQAVIFELLLTFGAVMFVSGITVIILAALNFQPPVTFADYAPSGLKFGFDPFYLMLLVITHRADYGNHLLIIGRELNSGMGVFPLFVANSLKLLMMVIFKSFVGALVVYTFQTPFMDFGSFWSAWLLTTWAWAAFTQWISIFCQNKQITAMLVLILWSFGLADLSFFWQQCAVTATTGYPDSAMVALCPRNSIRSPTMFTPPAWSGYGVTKYWFWVALYTEEMQTYPAYVANMTVVNRTNYWMGIVNEKSELQNPDYQGLHNFAIAVLLVNVFFHHLFILWMLYGMQNYVKEQQRKDAEARKKCCNMLNPFRLCWPEDKPPQDVFQRVQREMTQLLPIPAATTQKPADSLERKYSGGV